MLSTVKKIWKKWVLQPEEVKGCILISVFASVTYNFQKILDFSYMSLSLFYSWHLWMDWPLIYFEVHQKNNLLKFKVNKIYFKDIGHFRGRFFFTSTLPQQTHFKHECFLPVILSHRTMSGYGLYRANWLHKTHW